MQIGKQNENEQTHNILKDKYYICAIHNLCGLSRTLNTFEDTLGILMYQAIPRVFVQAKIVDLPMKVKFIDIDLENVYKCAEL